MRNISTTKTEIYESAHGNVRVERMGKGQWKVWPIGAQPMIVKSQQEAFRRARELDADVGGLRDVYQANKSAATLDAEIDAFLAKRGHGHRRT